MEENLKQAIELVLEYNLPNTSLLVRKMNITYNEAAGLIEQMENLGAIGPFKGSRPRKILIKTIVELKMENR